jgi:conjugal transfer mating pair stabilization protein TraN
MSGWGDAIGLGGCKAHEKQLAYLRNKGYCVPIGSYCSSWAPMKAWCVTKKNSYCCFKGKLQRILQVAGHQQLGISWGSPEHPNCQGLSVEDLQDIDFSQLDLSEVYGDALAGFKQHDVDEIKDRIKRQVTNQADKGSYAHGKVHHD